MKFQQKYKKLRQKHGFKEIALSKSQNFVIVERVLSWDNEFWFFGYFELRQFQLKCSRLKSNWIKKKKTKK